MKLIRLRAVRLVWTFSRLSDIFHGLVYVDHTGRLYLRDLLIQT